MEAQKAREAARAKENAAGFLYYYAKFNIEVFINLRYWIKQRRGKSRFFHEDAVDDKRMVQ